MLYLLQDNKAQQVLQASQGSLVFQEILVHRASLDHRALLEL